VGIANGLVKMVADSLEEMARRRKQIEPDPAKCFSGGASRDYAEVVEIWGMGKGVRNQIDVRSIWFLTPFPFFSFQS
jgi:hypothetical protein